MKLQLFNRSRKAMILACWTVLAAGVFSVSARADAWDKKTILTVDQPMQIRDTFLEPGQYVLRLLPSTAERHVVQIFNSDQSHLISTVMAVPAYKVNPSSHTQFTFWETPPGTAKALRAWYYPGDNYGNEFPYPKCPRQLAVAKPPQVAVVQPPPQPAPQPEVVEETVTEVIPEPEPVEPTPEPEAERAAPVELPKTGSPYPLIGLCGLALAGLAGALTLRKRSA